jgi:hypothetical protein
MAAANGGASRRSRPNMLVTGTPGTGKTTTCSLLSEAAGLRHVNIGDLVREKSLHDGWDDDLECHVINEDLVSLLHRGPPPFSQSWLLCSSNRVFWTAISPFLLWIKLKIQVKYLISHAWILKIGDYFGVD